LIAFPDEIELPKCAIFQLAYMQVPCNDLSTKHFKQAYCMVKIVEYERVGQKFLFYCVSFVSQKLFNIQNYLIVGLLFICQHFCEKFCQYVSRICTNIDCESIIG